MAASRPGAGDHKDAVVFSPHKFVGGPQTPGVLVVRRELVGNRAPAAPATSSGRLPPDLERLRDFHLPTKA
jgi:selenocysteine lyase/cysteine desulfurase